jgi:hypothetical protein
MLCNGPMVIDCHYSIGHARALTRWEDGRRGTLVSCSSARLPGAGGTLAAAASVEMKQNTYILHLYCTMARQPAIAYHLIGASAVNGGEGGTKIATLFFF